MNMRTGILLLLVLVIAVGGCGHTNNLAKYKVQGGTALFRAYTSGSAGSYAHVQSPAKDNTILAIISAIGSGIVSDQGRRKLEEAINRDSIANSVAQGMRQATTDYLSITAVDSISQNPDFIIETEITDFDVVSSSWGLSMHVRAKSRMIDRKSGSIIWDDAESHTIPLTHTFAAAFAPKPVSSAASVYNAVELLSLSEEEIRSVIDQASLQAGREIGETLREDIADLNSR